MKFFQTVELFADADELDRFARNGLDGQGSTAAGIAIELGHDDTVDAESFIEGRCSRNGILTGHGVDDEQDFMGMDFILDIDEFIHECFINM